jgi:imidazolonepropionase-like amidohydrolase
MRDLLITDVGVFDSRRGVLVDGPVWIADGVIQAVGSAAVGAAGTGAERLSGNGGTVIPGLIDCHCHAYGISLDGAWTESRELSYVALVAAERLGAALRRGFTTIRDVAGGDPGLAVAIAEGRLPSPRYLYTGPALSQTGGHGDPRSVDEASCGCAAHHLGGIGCEVVDGVDAVRAAVRDRFRRGAHAIKIMASGGVMSLTDPIRSPQYSAEEIRAAVDETRRRGSYVCAHAYSPEAVQHAVSNGVRSIEHGNLLDSPTAELMADRGAVLVPTLATYDAMGRWGVEIGMNPVSLAKNAEVLEHGRRAIELARAAGVTVGFGTDLMGELEREQLNGLRLQAEVEGVVRTLQAATIVNAEILGRADLGVVEAGAAADLVVLPGDVIADPALVWGGQRTVVQDGRVVAGRWDGGAR